VIWLLLRTYSAAWRREFGSEFEDLLRRRPLSILVVVNVIGAHSSANDRRWRNGGSDIRRAL
jgi:hypothetical protein